MPEVSSSISNPGTSGFTCYTRRHRLPLMAQRIFTLILALCSTSVFAGLFDADVHNLSPDQAFTFDFQQNQHDLNLTWQIKDGYYLYRKQIRITPEHAKIADVQLPQGVWHEDEFYGKSEIYCDRLDASRNHQPGECAGATLTVTYQGCADAGFCYPPETKTVPLSEVVSTTQRHSLCLFQARAAAYRAIALFRALGVVDRYWYRLYAMRAANVPTDFWHRAGW